MQKDLVSIVTCCYNGEKYVKRFLDSILNQTYNKVQLIFVNDGSTDNTEKVVLGYEAKFKKKNIDFIYVSQENMGLAGAINTGLKYITGEFLIWGDSDDYYELDAFESMVKVLTKNEDISYVRGGVYVRNESDLSLIEVREPIDKKKENLFYDYIDKTKNAYCLGGVNMLRTEYFINCNKGRDIYISNSGQNWQILLPVAYNGKTKYIDKIVYNYLIRENSHSHIKRTLKQKLVRNIELKNILINVIKKIDMRKDEKNHLIKTIRKRYFKERIVMLSNSNIFPFILLKPYFNRKKSKKDKNTYVISKNKCTGCTACLNICPKNAISMQEDEEGFKYPVIDKNLCINCGLCRKVCPVLSSKNVENKVEAYACYNKKEDYRMNSSSGGMFNLFASYILDKNGVVVAPLFDKNIKLNHVVCNNKKDLVEFMGSKYLQSNLSDIFKQVKRKLDKDCYVLFCGTPCQVEGLLSYLKKDYDKLYTQDIICHGVPSQKMLDKYLSEISSEKVKKINFRNKSEGWKNYSLNIEYDNKVYNSSHLKDKYMRLFIKNYCLRYSCYNCSFKKENRLSDITLGDFWGIDNVIKDFNDDKGITLTIINSKKGKELFNNIKRDIIYKKVNINDAIKYNSAYIKSANKPFERKDFYKKLDKKGFTKMYNMCFNKSIFRRIYVKIMKSISKEV